MERSFPLTFKGEIIVTRDPVCYYSNNVKAIEVRVSRIGNSRGIRIPASVLRKYGITDKLLLEQRADEIVLRTKKRKKFSWKETFEEMAREKEDWSDLEVTLADGLDED